jgi:hypothetical protein
MGNLFTCCQLRAAPRDEESQAQVLMANSHAKQEIEHIVLENRSLGRVLPLVKGVRTPFKATDNRGSSLPVDSPPEKLFPASSPVSGSLDPTGTFEGLSIQLNSSDDEGGIAGELDSSDGP